MQIRITYKNKDEEESINLNICKDWDWLDTLWWDICTLLKQWATDIKVEEYKPNQ